MSQVNKIQWIQATIAQIVVYQVKILIKVMDLSIYTNRNQG